MIVGAALIAASVLLGSGGIVWAVLRHTKSFGDYEAVLFAVQETQQAILGQNDQLLQELRKAKSNGHKEVA